MSLDSDIAVLRSVQLFDGLHDDQLRLLAFGADKRRLSAGEFVFRESARADAGFVIIKGTVELFRGRGERHRMVASYEPGTLFGEMALITETVRPGSARASTPCELLRIGRPLFRRMLEEYPAYAESLHARLTDELAEMTRKLLELESRFT